MQGKTAIVQFANIKNVIVVNQDHILTLENELWLISG